MLILRHLRVLYIISTRSLQFECIAVEFCRIIEVGMVMLSTKGKGPSYRSKEAQSMHTSIIKYIDKRDPSVKVDFSWAGADTLKVLSINGCSHLIDIFHLSQDRIPDDEVLSDKIAYRLFSALVARSKVVGQGTLEFLLLHSNNDGFTPLHQVLKSCLNECVALYFNLLKECVKKKVILLDTLVALLVSVNKGGFTPLHSALKTGQIDNLKLYLESVRHCMKKDWISKDAQVQLLVGPTKMGFTPLHQALKLGQSECLRLYLDLLKECVQKNVILPGVLVALLVGVNNAGFTPLNQALITGQIDNLELYLEPLKHFAEKGLISKDTLIKFLIGGDPRGFTSLHQALASNQEKCATRYLEMLNGFIEKDLIGPLDLKQLLVSASKTGLTPLYQAVFSGHMKVVDEFFHMMEKHLSEGEIASALFSKNKGKKLMLFCPGNTDSASSINAYLALKRDAYKSYLPQEEATGYHSGMFARRGGDPHRRKSDKCAKASSARYSKN